MRPTTLEGGDRGLDLIGMTDVNLPGARDGAGVAAGLRGCLRALCLRVPDRHMHSGRGQSQGHRAADALRRAGDDGRCR